MNYHVRHRDDIGARSVFIRAKKFGERYAVTLRKAARHVDDIIKGFNAATLQGQVLIQAALIRYREALRPWAEATADRFVAEVAAADRNAWRRISGQLGRGIEKEITSAPIASVVAQMKSEQVRLITSLPTEAAERVNKLVTEGLSTGRRANEIAKDIYETGSVTKSRATLIARTETGRAATTLTQARAQHIGSPGYIWKTAGDSDVRASHKAMQGKFVAWDEPPTLDGLTGHAGALPNCRCYVAPVIPD